MEWELHTVPFFFTKDGEPSSPGSGLTFQVYSQFCISILSLSAVAKNAELNLLNANVSLFLCKSRHQITEFREVMPLEKQCDIRVGCLSHCKQSYAPNQTKPYQFHTFRFPSDAVFFWG